MNHIIFFIIILVSNCIQGITGFAGTILAMPPSLMLVGYDVAKPVLNVLGLLSGIYVFMTHGKHVNWDELKKIVIIMGIGIAGGILLHDVFVGKEKIMYSCLGGFVIVLSLVGLYRISNVKREARGKKNNICSYILLIAAGLVHGMFVSGGPLVIGYLSKTIKEKVSFRATISTVWIILNTIIMLDDIRTGLWNVSLLKIQLISIPFMLVGMFIGARLYKKMSQKFFMKLTYVLLFVSGVSLLIK